MLVNLFIDELKALLLSFFPMTTLPGFLFRFLALASVAFFLHTVPVLAEVTLVKDGASPIPILAPKDASEETLLAAQNLATYIEKITGAKPEVRQGAGEKLPESAIWIGSHPELPKVFPGLNLELPQPEEILIASQGLHILLLGRDTFGQTRQLEYGTANAVYSFLQKYLDVRWLWPGALGEDIIQKKTVTLPSFEYRFHPPFLQREIFRLLRSEGPLRQWSRFHHIYLDSFFSPNGHGFTDWWEKYSKTNPDYFALQPDGTRSGFPGPGKVKIFEANPKVWQQWLENAEATIKADPDILVLNAAPNDSSNSGVSVDPESRAWDNPKGAPYVFSYAKGVKDEHVALSDRYVKFWNILAKGLKERFPGQRRYVGAFGYGPTKFPPLDGKLEDNVSIAFVGHFPLVDETARLEEKANWKGWADNASFMLYRPNLFIYSGAWHGYPSVTLKNTIEDFRFLAENKCKGLTIDTTPEFWAAQCVQYYLMAQLAWDPLQDGWAVVKDFYQRGFGPAAPEIEEYFQLVEKVHMRIINTPGWRPSLGNMREMSARLPEYYNAEFLAAAGEILDRADRKVASASDLYRQRVAFIRTGLDFARNQSELTTLMTRIREVKGHDAAAVQRALELSAHRDEIMARFDGAAYAARRFNVTFLYNSGRDLRDYMGPPGEAFITASKSGAPMPEVAQSGSAKKAAAEAADATAEYRWTNQGEKPLWSVVENWKFKKGDRWIVPAQPPGPGNRVMLGNIPRGDAPAEGPIRILLDTDVSVAGITVESTSPRAFVISKRDYDGEGETLDSDSGRIFTLTLSGDEAFKQTTGAEANLIIEVPLVLSAAAPVALLDSQKEARIALKRKVTAVTPVQEKKSSGKSNGVLVQDEK